MKKEVEEKFELKFIDETIEKKSINLNLPKYTPNTTLDTFPIPYLDETVKEIKAEEETTVYDSKDVFVSPITGAHKNKSLENVDESTSLAGYETYRINRGEEKSKRQIKKEYDLLDTNDYLNILENGRLNRTTNEGYELDIVDEVNDNSQIDAFEELPPIYEEETTYEYIEEESAPNIEAKEIEKIELSDVEPSPQVSRFKQNDDEDLISRMEEVKQTDNFTIKHEEKVKEEKRERKEVTPPKMERVQKSVKYVAPPLDILKSNSGTLTFDDAWAQEKQEIINRVFVEFNYGAKAIGYKVGPTVTLFLIDIEPGTDVNRLNSFSNTLQMRLKAISLRIQSPIIGFDCAGIEIANENRTNVLMGNLINKNFISSPKKLEFPLGLNVNGEISYADIEKMPHALVAGATNSGKSVCINALIVSLLYKNSPDELRFILIDPKMVELILYEDIPHLAIPVITEPKKAAPAFKWVCEEMDRRFAIFSTYKVRNIAGYNDLARRNNSKIMPRIVVIIDELADLMLVVGSEIESYIMRLGAKARAAGIHVILATQRPSTDVVKGTMKNNIPTRIAFRVTSPIDSVTILDHGGAEKLLGYGDMLYKTEFGEERIQGAFISDEEIRDIVNYFYENFTQDFLLNETQLQEKIVETVEDEEDELFEEIAYFCVRNETASTNQLQKTFKISFNRADRIVLQMERLGIVSGTVRGKSREVIVNVDQLEEILENR